VSIWILFKQVYLVTHNTYHTQGVDKLLEGLQYEIRTGVQEEATSYQSQRFGRFFQRTLPYGRSGVGNTSTIMHLTKNHFVNFVCCYPLSGDLSDFPDDNFHNLVDQITIRARALPIPTSQEDYINRDRDEEDCCLFD
jgi:hypothetical protein